MAKKQKQEAAEEKELTPKEKWEKKVKANADRCSLIRKLIYEFYELYEPKVIKEAPHLQLQIQLYRDDAIRLANEAAELMQKTYLLPKEI